MGAGEALQDFVRLLDAREKGVAGGADNVARLVDAEDIGQAENRRTRHSLTFVVEAGFKCRQQGTSGRGVIAELAALGIAEQRGVGQ